MRRRFHDAKLAAHKARQVESWGASVSAILEAVTYRYLVKTCQAALQGQALLLWLPLVASHGGRDWRWLGLYHHRLIGRRAV